MRKSPTLPGPAGLCGSDGYLAPLTWAQPAHSAALARQLTSPAEPANVTASPHLSQGWARRAAACPGLLREVCALIGPEVAVENTLLLIKRPGDGFAVPPHQDGINDRIELDPARSVAAWLAITDATAANGCLEVLPGSHRHGYLPYRRAQDATASGRRPLTTGTPAGEAAFAPLPLAAGQACVLDVRLVHRSGPNVGTGMRAGLNIRYVAPGAWTLRAGPPPRVYPVTGDRW